MDCHKKSQRSLGADQSVRRAYRRTVNFRLRAETFLCFFVASQSVVNK